MRSNSTDSVLLRAAAPATTRARLAHVLHARAGDVLAHGSRSASSAFARACASARLHVGRIEPAAPASPAFDGVALAHGDFDDRLLGLGDELDAVALERAEERVAAVAATGGEREGKARDRRPPCMLHSTTPRPRSPGSHAGAVFADNSGDALPIPHGPLGLPGCRGARGGRRRRPTDDFDRHSRRRRRDQPRLDVRRKRARLPRRPRARARRGLCRARERRREPRRGGRRGAHPGGLAALQRRQGRGVQPRRHQRARRLDHGRRDAESGRRRGRPAHQEPDRARAHGHGAHAARDALRRRRGGIRARAGRDAGARQLLLHRAALEAARGSAAGGEERARRLRRR